MNWKKCIKCGLVCGTLCAPLVHQCEASEAQAGHTMKKLPVDDNHEERPSTDPAKTNNLPVTTTASPNYRS